MIRLLLVEDHPILRIGIKIVIEQMPDTKVMGEASNGKEAISLMEQQPFDIVLMDVNMPEMDGVEAAKIMKRKHPEVKVLIYSGVEENNNILKAITAGADGYLFKSDNTGELKVAIEAVMKGEKYLSRRISNNLMPFLVDRLRKQSDSGDGCELSAREKEILSLILEANSSKQIAKILCLSYRTVDTHRYNLMKKLGCSNMAELFKCAIEKQLV